jgi:enoyl-CoA hydratase
MTYQEILVERHGRVGLIRLNRPQALNALSSPLNDELGHAGLRSHLTIYPR